MFDWLTGKSHIESFFWAIPVSNGIIILALLAAIIVTIVLYRRTPDMPIWLRIVLAVSRFIMLVLIASILFKPTVTVSDTQTTRKRLAVMIDVSQSMSIRDQRKSDIDITEAADNFFV